MIDTYNGPNEQIKWLDRSYNSAYRTNIQKIIHINVLLGKETTHISVTTILPEVTSDSTRGGHTSSTQRNPPIIIIGKLLKNVITEWYM